MTEVLALSNVSVDLPLGGFLSRARLTICWTEPGIASPVPRIAFTSAMYFTLTLWPAICSSHVPRIVSRLPASKSMSLRSTRLLGVAMTCLPFWYL